MVSSVNNFSQALVSPYLRSDPSQQAQGSQDNGKTTALQTFAQADGSSSAKSASGARAGRGGLVDITV